MIERRTDSEKYRLMCVCVYRSHLSHDIYVSSNVINENETALAADVGIVVAENEK